MDARFEKYTKKEACRQKIRIFGRAVLELTPPKKTFGQAERHPLLEIVRFFPFYDFDYQCHIMIKVLLYVKLCKFDLILNRQNF